VDIQRPRLALPSIRAQGEALEVLADVQGASGTPAFELQIESNFYSYGLPVDSTQDLGSGMWKIFSHVSDSVSPDLFHLILTADGVEDLEIHALSVVSGYSEDFKFIHLTDVHQGYSAVQDENFREDIEHVNLIHPDFAVITGDIAEDVNSTYYEAFLDRCESFTVPIFVLNGNHDHYGDSLVYYDMVNPYAEYTFDFGNHHFTAFNTGPDNGFPLYRCRGLMPAQLAWYEADLQAHQGSTLRFALMHGPMYDVLTPNVYGRNEFVALCDTYDVRMVLAGHTHYDRVHDKDGYEQSGDVQPLDGTIFVQTTSAAKEGVFTDDPGYRLIRVMNGDVFTYTVDRDGNGARDAEAALIAEDMTIGYLHPDDGTSTVQQVTVDNGHNDYFEDCRLLLHMAEGYYYESSGAAIARQRGGWVDVRIDSISPLSTTIIGVQASAIPCGDANADTTVTTGDGYFVLNYFGSGPEPPLCWAANSDGTGSLTPSDGYRILNYFGTQGELHCETCGEALLASPMRKVQVSTK
jgi:3',5'-cyclic AMP phosphodiesterase CpdA